MRNKKALAMLIAIILLGAAPANVFALQRSDVLMAGDQDEWVLELQKELYDRELLDAEPTGYFGTETQKAVRDFQKETGLKADGKAGPETRKNLLKGKYKPIPEGTRSVFGTGQEAAKDMYIPGDIGEEVTRIQKRLMALGYYQYSQTTGYFGPITRDAVEQFQEAHGLEKDGILGRETQTVLWSEGAIACKLEIGDKGDDVRKLQEKLKEYGYFTKEVTGYFGPITKNAVEKFQLIHGLSVDGKAGNNTFHTLNSTNVKKYNQPEPVSTTTTQKSRKDKGQELAQLAQDQQGKHYLWGGGGPCVFDSAGLIHYCLKNLGLATPRTLGTMSEMEQWQEVSKEDLVRGDLVFFAREGAGQVYQGGIYLGNGEFIHASAQQRKVVVSDLEESQWEHTFLCGRRIG